MRDTAVEEKRRFVVLDGLRGAAAFLVITDHIPSAVSDLVPSRALAVDFFFVLSGFVLAHAYVDRLNAGMSQFAFMRTRLIRLYPLYFLASCLGAAYFAILALKGWAQISASEFATVSAFALAFVPCPPFYSWTGGLPYPFDNPAWSLFFELIGNLAFAYIVFLRRPAALQRFLPLAALALIFAAWFYASFDTGWNISHLGGGAARIGYGFFAGVLLYDVWRRGSPLRIPAWAAFAGLIAIAAVAQFVPAPAVLACDVALELVAIPLLVLAAAEAEVNGTAARVCSFLGVHSYGVYLLHPPILAFLGLVLGKLHLGPATGSGILLLVAAISLCAAWLAYHAYDVPVRAWLTRHSRAPLQRAGSGAPV